MYASKQHERVCTRVWNRHMRVPACSPVAMHAYKRTHVHMHARTCPPSASSSAPSYACATSEAARAPMPVRTSPRPPNLQACRRMRMT
eukprot:364893-Chlamydomonas_euryale.AAC.4